MDGLNMPPFPLKMDIQLLNSTSPWEEEINNSELGCLSIKFGFKYCVGAMSEKTDHISET